MPHVKIGRIRIDGELLPQVLSVGVSALLMQILTLVQQTVIYRVASNYGGETSQLLLGAALRFWNFSFVPLWGISQGFQPAAGTNYGAKDYDRVKTLTRVFITAATLLSLVFYIPAELFPEKILSMFLTTPGIAASGATNFRIMFSTYVLQGSFMIAVSQPTCGHSSVAHITQAHHRFDHYFSAAVRLLIVFRQTIPCGICCLSSFR